MDSLTELLSGPSNLESQEYLEHLTALDLPTLLSEPAVLQTQSHHLTSSLTSLTHTSYPTFISLHESIQELTVSLEGFNSSLNSLVNDSLPALETSVSGWKERTRDILSERRRARVVLDQHDKIRDLLDIPLLIDTCVRNGYFSEALSLASHATSVATTHSTKTQSLPPLMLNSVLSEVQHSVTQMLLSLLSTLNEPNRKLPALFKAVTFIRKMDFFQEDTDSDVEAEEKIALAFLTGRETCFKAAQDSVARDVSRLCSTSPSLDDREEEDLVRYLRKYIDLWREGVYDIITQYTTIFLERSPYSSHTSAKSPMPVSPLAKQSAFPHIPLGRLHRLISTYASHALSTHLLPVLSSALPHLPTSALPSFLTQLTYCSAAFAKVGLDFRGLLPSLFEGAVLSAFQRDLQKALDAWLKKIENASGSSMGEEARRALISPLSPSKRKSVMVTTTPPAKWLAPPAVILSPIPKSVESISLATTPPHILASFPPLAQYTNDILTALNNLRLLAPISLGPATLQALDGVIASGGRSLLQYIRMIVSSSLSNRDELPSKEAEQEDIAKKAGEAYFHVLCPYLRKALAEGVYGGCTPSVAEGLAAVLKEWHRWHNPATLHSGTDNTVDT